MSPADIATVEPGARVAYEDARNPRREGTVTAILDSRHGRHYSVTFGRRDTTTTDLRQHGWTLLAPLTLLTPVSTFPVMTNAEKPAPRFTVKEIPPVYEGGLHTNPEPWAVMDGDVVVQTCASRNEARSLARMLNR